mgnify:CR=1 FL=1
MKKDFRISSAEFSDMLNEDTEFLPLMSDEDEAKISKEDTPNELPILPLRNTVLFPGVIIPITVGRKKPIDLVKDAYHTDKIIGVVAQKNSKAEDPTYDDIYKIGTIAKIIKPSITYKYVERPQESYSIVDAKLAAAIKSFSVFILFNNIFDTEEISESIKANFSFCWYQFYKFLFIFTTRWRVNITDLETLAIGLVVLLNTVGNKSFKVKDLNRKNWNKISQGADDVGVNAMSLSDITGIPRPTVVRKLKFLIKGNYLHINEKKLITLNITGLTLKKTNKLQDLNMKNLSNFLYRIFNQIKVINTN